jgi:SAM-dependent methyltransferase
VIYAADLAYVHQAGFDEYATRAAPVIAKLLRGRGLRRGHVVEFGCGGGTLAAHLTSLGYDVLGVDQSPAMIRMARQNAPAARFRVGSLASTAIPRCDAIVAIGEVVSYLSGNTATDVPTFLHRSARALRPGGLLIFDFIESAEGRTFPAKSRAGGDWAIVMRAEAKGRTLTRHITTFRKVGGRYRRSMETHRVRLYSRRQVGAALREAGFAFSMRRSIGPVRLIRGNVMVVAAVQ